MDQPSKRGRFLRNLGVVLAAIGFALLIYFAFVYDSWVWVDASPPPGVDDFGERVLYEDSGRVVTARVGRWVGLGALVVGATALGVALVRSSEEG